MSEPLRVEITIAAPIDEVWRSLRDPERLRRWHGWHFDGLDEEIDVIYRQNVTESASDHTLTLNGHDAFSLHALDDGRTLVRLVRAPRGSNPDWDAYYDDISEGWITFLEQLRFALERHPGEDRRTVFLAGRGDGIAAFDLQAVSARPIGSAYDAEVAGQRIRGHVWFRSDHQLGVTVDLFGDGLLVAAATPAKAGEADGQAMAVITTYGLADAAFADLEARWTTAWSERVVANPA